MAKIDWPIVSIWWLKMLFQDNDADILFLDTAIITGKSQDIASMGYDLFAIDCIDPAAYAIAFEYRCGRFFQTFCAINLAI